MRQRREHWTPTMGQRCGIASCPCRRAGGGTGRVPGSIVTALPNWFLCLSCHLRSAQRCAQSAGKSTVFVESSPSWRQPRRSAEMSTERLAPLAPAVSHGLRQTIAAERLEGWRPTDEQIRGLVALVCGEGSSGDTREKHTPHTPAW